MADVQAAIEYIFPLIYEFRKEKVVDDSRPVKKRKLSVGGEVATFVNEDEEAREESDNSDFN